MVRQVGVLWWGVLDVHVKVEDLGWMPFVRVLNDENLEVVCRITLEACVRSEGY